MSDMAKGELTINGIDAYTEWGVTLTDSGLTALMTPTGMKTPVENSSTLQHGKRPFLTGLKQDSRTVSLPINLTAPDKATFFARYASFCATLATGVLDIESSYQPGVIYHTYYQSCSQFSEFAQEMASFTLKLTEYDPSNRS
jgi:hypothetical protein